MKGRKAPLEERFWEKVQKTDTCWLWTGMTGGSGGYGEIKEHGKRRRAHRVSYEMVNGPIPEGLVIDHKCHVVTCVRPDHLQAVTNKQNVENHSGAKPSSKTGIRGVSWSKTAKKYVVFVKHYGLNHHGGAYSDIKEAEAAAIALRNRLHTNNLADRKAAA